MKKKITWSKSSRGYSTPKLTFPKKEFDRLELFDFVEIEYLKDKILIRPAEEGKKISWNKSGKGYLSPKISFSKKEFDRLELFDFVEIEYLEKEIIITK